MSKTPVAAEWGRSLIQADGFARAGATDEAVARALAVQRAVAEALEGSSHTPDERTVLQTYFDRSGAELDRFRTMHGLAVARTTARAEAYRARERSEMAARSGSASGAGGS